MEHFFYLLDADLGAFFSVLRVQIQNLSRQPEHPHVSRKRFSDRKHIPRKAVFLSPPGNLTPWLNPEPESFCRPAADQPANRHETATLVPGRSEVSHYFRLSDRLPHHINSKLKNDLVLRYRLQVSRLDREGNV